MSDEDLKKTSLDSVSIVKAFLGLMILISLEEGRAGNEFSFQPITEWMDNFLPIKNLPPRGLFSRQTKKANVENWKVLHRQDEVTSYISPGGNMLPVSPLQIVSNHNGLEISVPRLPFTHHFTTPYLDLKDKFFPEIQESLGLSQLPYTTVSLPDAHASILTVDPCMPAVGAQIYNKMKGILSRR